jgi:peptidoglycan/LPS O-acetylase OafA/YrhL
LKPQNPQTIARPTDLGTGPSLFLDIGRLSAALCVALGHLTQMSEGWGNLTDLAVNAVTAFFLLSGFVIRYVTVRRRGSWPNYLADRASRLYSVVLPAMLLATVTDVIVTHLLWHASIQQAFSFAHLAGAAFTNLTFTTYIWHMHGGYYTDGAMWSLCFEWGYYMLYGIAFYFTGWKRAIYILVVALIFGPDVLVLFPIWLAGCLLFEIFIRVRNRRRFLSAFILSLTVTAGLVLLHPVRNQLNSLRLGFAGIVHNWESHGQTSGSSLFFLAPKLGHDTPVSLNAYVWGALFFILMLLGLLFADRLTINPDSRSSRTIRLLAEATFPLYLVHLPIYLFIITMLGHNIISTAGKLSVFFGVFALSVYLGVIFNRYKLILRSWFLRIIPGATVRPSKPRITNEEPLVSTSHS